MKTSELTGTDLDRAVAMALGWAGWKNPHQHKAAPSYSTDWAQGGPIIEREKLIIGYIGEIWECRYFEDSKFKSCEYGLTPLIAAMRCYVASKLGNKVEIPEELL